MFIFQVFHLDTPDALMEFYTPGSTKDDAFQVISYQIPASTKISWLKFYHF